jgi:hypothetical protein
VSIDCWVISSDTPRALRSFTMMSRSSKLRALQAEHQQG